MNVTASGQQLVRIMPLGNSITKGTAGSDYDIGYRRLLYLSLTDSGYNIDFVGSQVHGLLLDFDRDHEGHGGWEANEIRDNIYAWLVANPADIILLHIGTNDLSHGNVDVSEVDQLLDNIDQFEADYDNPITVLLARIILRADGLTPATIIFNDSVEALAQERIAAGDKIVMVDMENALIYPDDLSDNVHPNQTGYDKMALTWLPHILPLLPAPSCPDSMIHYWNFSGEDGSAFTDIWSGLEAACGPCPDSLQGIVGEVAEFDGVEEVSTVYTGDLDWSKNGSFTIEFWLKPEVSCSSMSDSYEQVVVGREGSGESLDHWKISVYCTLSDTGRIRFELYDTLGGTTVTSTSNTNDSSWHHVAVVRDGSIFRNSIYVDGELQASETAAYAYGFASTSGLSIGYWPEDPTGLHYKGMLDELAIYRRALEENELLSHYNRGGDGAPYCDGAIAPVVSSTPDTETLVDQTYSYNVDASGDPEPVYRLLQSPPSMSIDSVTGLIEWVPDYAYLAYVSVEAYNIRAADTQSFSINVVQPPDCPELMTHYWKFDDSDASSYADYVGSSTATCGSCPVTATGIVDDARLFSGSNLVDATDDNSFDWGPSQDFSVEFWMNKSSYCTGTSNSENNVIVGRYGTGNDALNIWWVGVNCSTADGTQGCVRFVLRDVSNTGVILLSNNSVIDGNWHHVVAMRDAAADMNRLYVDAVKVDSAVYSYSEGFSDATNLNIGYINFGGYFGYEGILDELALYDKVLTPDEVVSHYQDGLLHQGYCSVCGDADHSGIVNVSDAVYLISFIFGGGSAPPTLESGDADCNRIVNISDAVYLIAYVFGTGPAPCASCP